MQSKIKLSAKIITSLKRKKEQVNSFLLLSLRVILLEYGTILRNGKVYVSQDFEKGTPFIFSLTLEDNQPNVMMLKTLKKYYFWKSFEQNFNLGLVYYENQFIKVNMLEAVKICKAV